MTTILPGLTCKTHVSRKLVNVEIVDVGGPGNQTYTVKNLHTGRTLLRKVEDLIFPETEAESGILEVSTDEAREIFASELAVSKSQLEEAAAEPIPAPAANHVTKEAPMSVGNRLRAAINPATDTAPHVIVQALAGTGKTTTLIEGLKRVKGIESRLTPSPQQAAVWEAMELSKGVANTICFAAFNKSIATELQSRVPAGCDAMTMHSMGLKAVTATFGRVKIESYRVSNLIAAELERDVRELRKTEPTLLRATEDLVGLCKLNLVDAEDAEELDRLASHYQVELNGTRDKVFALVPKILERCKDPRKDGMIDFDDMIWLPVALQLPVTRYDLLLVDEVQDLNKCQQELAKRAGKRLILCGDRNQCHPTGTLVTKTGGEQVPIESLKVGDYLVTFNPNAGKLAGTETQGRKIEEIASRDYAGDLYWINGTPCTPNHRWPTKFKEESRTWTAIYLMEMEDGSFRIGQTQLVHAGGNGFGPGLRARQEKATKLWLLDVVENKTEAREQEFKNSLRYRIPQRVCYEELEDSWSLELIDEGIPPLVDECLARYGRRYEFPIWEKGDAQHIGTRRVSVTQACNLIPGVSLIAKRKGDTQEVDWIPLDLNIDENWVGKVWSLRVQPTEKDRRLYLANGNVTHNSIYGFAGADAQSMDRLEADLGTTDRGVVTLPLTVTRRCGKAIVAEAQRIVPLFEAHETNGEGKISRAAFSNKTKDGGLSSNATYHGLVQDGDMVLCRVNAPLVSECFRFLRAGRKAIIRGRDIGQGLISTVKKMKAANVADLIGKLSDWLHNEVTKENAKRNPSESKIIGLQDRFDCLSCFAESATTVDGVIAKIESVFSDTNGSGIVLSSVHKAKGLEADRVFLLQPEKATIPHPMAKSYWQRDQEWNIRYVAITRARESLVYVS